MSVLQRCPSYLGVRREGFDCTTVQCCMRSFATFKSKSNGTIAEARKGLGTDQLDVFPGWRVISSDAFTWEKDSPSTRVFLLLCQGNLALGKPGHPRDKLSPLCPRVLVNTS